MKILIAACVLLVGGAFGIAASSIGIECGNYNERKYKNDRQTNFNFLVANLVCTILMVLCGSSLCAIGIRTGGR